MKRLLFVTACLTFLFCVVEAQDIGSVFQQRQNELKAKDSLAKWIDNRVNFALENPEERLPFLMETSKNVWRQPSTPQENEAWLFLLINQGYYQLQNGDILVSIKCYENAYQFFQKQPFDLDIEEYILKPLSNNYTRLGDYERAIYIQNRSLNLALKQGNNQLATSAYCNLSTSYRSKNDLENAEKCTLEGLKIVDKSSAIYGLLLSNMADVKNENRDYGLATSFSSKAIDHLKSQLKSTSTTYWLLSAYTLAGDIELNKTNYSQANLYYNTAQSIINKSLKGTRTRELTYILNQLAKISVNQKRYTEALSYYNQAITLLIPNQPTVKHGDLPNKKLLYGENKLQAALIGKANVLELLGNQKISLEASILAFEVSEKLRAEFTYNVSKEQLQTESKALAELVIEKSYSLWLSTKDKIYAENILLFSEKSKSRTLYDELYTNQQNKIGGKANPLVKQNAEAQQLLSYYQKQSQTKPNAKLNNKIADLKFQLSTFQKELNVKNPNLSDNATEILAKIPKDKKALIFFSGEKYTYLIVASHSHIENILKLEATSAISKLITHYLDKYFYRGPNAMANHPDEFYSASNKIYKQLFSQINIRKEKLLIVKDGVLNFLPFESLITSDRFNSNIANWPFLIKTTEVSYAFSLSSIALVEHKTTDVQDKFTGVFLSKTGSDNNGIPAVLAEFDALRKLIGGRFIKNENVSLVNFKKALAHSSVLHISSHSYLTDSLKEPVIDLYRNRFYLLELNAEVTVPKLVILSACQTADGAYLSGEGVLSFSRGFIASGSKGVISSLWNVNDKSAADLMVSYYKILKQLGTTSGTLSKTKLGWLNQKHKSQMMLLPYYWDSLIYTGTDVSVSLAQPNSYIIYFVIAELFVLIFLGAVAFSKRKKLNISPTSR